VYLQLADNEERPVTSHRCHVNEPVIVLHWESPGLVEPSS
jgi:hypothetical protein